MNSLVHLLWEWWYERWRPVRTVYKIKLTRILVLRRKNHLRLSRTFYNFADGKWYRGITATVDEVRPDVFLIFHLDVGKYEWTPVCNLRPLPVDLLSPVARAIPLVVDSKRIDIEHTDSSIR